MALVWSTRAKLLEKDSGGKIKFIWNQGTIAAGSMAVIKGNPGGKDAAMKFIASAQDPAKQAIMFNLLGQGPANPATDALLPPAEARYNPVDPANAAQQVALNVDWYEKNYGATLDQYLKIVSA
jgi:putative spermidine/putrescine transport system substrate-binding protein